MDPDKRLKEAVPGLIGCHMVSSGPYSVGSMGVQLVRVPVRSTWISGGHRGLGRVH